MLFAYGYSREEYPDMAAQYTQHLATPVHAVAPAASVRKWVVLQKADKQILSFRILQAIPVKYLYFPSHFRIVQLI